MQYLHPPTTTSKIQPNYKNKTKQEKKKKEKRKRGSASVQEVLKMC